MHRTVRHLVVFCALAMAAVAVGAQGPPSPEYYYMYSGRQISLIVDETRFAVLDVEKRSPQAVAALLHAAGLRGFEPSAIDDRWTFFTVANASATPKLARPSSLEIVEELSGRPDVPFPLLTPFFTSPDFGALGAFPTEEIHVAFEPDVPLSVVEIELRRAGAGEILQIDWHKEGVYRVAAPKSGVQALRVANRLADHPEVRWAEPNMRSLVRAPSGSTGSCRGRCEPLDLPNNNEPNDEHFLESWGLEQDWGTDPDAPDLDAVDAWGICGGDPGPDGPIVAPMDDGFESAHPDLQGTFIDGVDTTSDCGAPDGICEGLIFSEPRGVHNNHGTAVASVLGGVANNGIGSLGIARIRMLAVRTATYTVEDGEVVGMVDSKWLVNAIHWAVARGANITTLSWNDFAPSDRIEEAYEDTRAAGVIHFVSVGNMSHGEQNTGVEYPATLPSVFGVGAIVTSGEVWEHSKTGPEVAFVAPGVDIFAADRTNGEGFTDGTDDPDKTFDDYGDDYVVVSGTSFATPLVAGTAALALSEAPCLTVDELEEALRVTAIDLGPPGRDNSSGWGLINTHQVLLFVTQIFKDSFESGNTSRWSSSKP